MEPSPGHGMPSGTVNPDPPDPPPPQSNPADSDDGSDDDGSPPPPQQTIAQRLGRRSRQAYDPYTEQGGGTHPHAGLQRSGAPPVSNVAVSEAMTGGTAASLPPWPSGELPPQSTALEVPDGVSFVLYLCAGGATGEGTIAHYLRAFGIYCVMVDVKQGGYGHDMMHAPVQRQIQDLAARPLCLAVLSSVPCGSWSVLRYVPQSNAPGVERRRPHHTRGIPRADGSLAPSVVLGNGLLDFAILISEIVIGHGGEAFFESPVSRAADSQFSMPGREDHVSMWDDGPLIDHMAAGRYQSFPFDQCCTRDHPCAQKTTRLAATPRLHRALHARFGNMRCQLPPSAHQSVPGGADSNGVFASEALSRYSPPMNELIAESVVEAVQDGTARPGGPYPTRAEAVKAPPVNLARNVQGGNGGSVQRGDGGKSRSRPVADVQGGNGGNETLADRELKIFHDAGYTIKLHPPDYFLGCNVEPGPTHHQLNITMSAYVTQLAEKYLPKPSISYPRYHVPCTKELFSSYERALLREQQPSPELLKTYGSKVGAMIFAAPAARFECAYGIGICARCITFPTAEMDAHADRIIAYMAQHADDGISFDGTRADASTFTFYSDSDWNVGHSTTGWCATYGGATVGYGSKRQHSVALSSTEAEIMAASLASCEAIFMRGLLREMGVPMDKPTVIRVDNQGAVALAKDRRSCHRSRHIQRRYLKIREWVALGEVQVEYVNTTQNPADILTKALERESFERHCATLSGGHAARPAAFLGGVSDLLALMSAPSFPPRRERLKTMTRPCGRPQRCLLAIERSGSRPATLSTIT